MCSLGEHRGCGGGNGAVDRTCSRRDCRAGGSCCYLKGGRGETGRTNEVGRTHGDRNGAGRSGEFHRNACCETVGRAIRLAEGVGDCRGLQCERGDCLRGDVAQSGEVPALEELHCPTRSHGALDDGNGASGSTDSRRLTNGERDVGLARGSGERRRSVGTTPEERRDLDATECRDEVRVERRRSRLGDGHVNVGVGRSGDTRCNVHSAENLGTCGANSSVEDLNGSTHLVGARSDLDRSGLRNTHISRGRGEAGNARTGYGCSVGTLRVTVTGGNRTT